MNPIVRNVLAVIVGWFGGSIVNMSLIKAGQSVFPFDGIDPNDMEALAEIMPTLDAEYFVFPFLAHAVGTLVGALIAGLIAANHKMKFSLSIGGLFLIGGIMINYMLPGPIWFAVLDIVVAYIPMAWIGGTLALKLLPIK
tara:strand:- start:183 stop:602 length:420 start_codon:yes stop_codon:yes gene_type:complete